MKTTRQCKQKKKLGNNIHNIFADIEDIFHVPNNIRIYTFYTPALCGDVYNLIYIGINTEGTYVR